MELVWAEVIYPAAITLSYAASLHSAISRPNPPVGEMEKTRKEAETGINLQYFSDSWINRHLARPRKDWYHNMQTPRDDPIPDSGKPFHSKDIQKNMSEKTYKTRRATNKAVTHLVIE